MLVDSHSHLDAAEFDADRDAVIARARAAGVTRQVRARRSMLPAGRSCATVCASGPGLFPAYGLHPMYLAAHRDEHLAELREWIERERPVAVGECGLDYFVDGLDPAGAVAFLRGPAAPRARIRPAGDRACAARGRRGDRGHSPGRRVARRGAQLLRQHGTGAAACAGRLPARTGRAGDLRARQPPARTRRDDAARMAVAGNRFARPARQRASAGSATSRHDWRWYSKRSPCCARPRPTTSRAQPPPMPNACSACPRRPRTQRRASAWTIRVASATTPAPCRPRRTRTRR